MFTFYCLVKDGADYYFKPYITIYNNMIEIVNYPKSLTVS